MTAIQLIPLVMTVLSGVVLVLGIGHRRFASMESRLDSMDRHLLSQQDQYVRTREYESDKRSTEAWLSRIETKIDTLLGSKK